MSRRVPIGAVPLLCVAFGFVAGYGIGKSSEEKNQQQLTQDSMTARRLVDVEKDILTLSQLRGGKSVVPDLELWVSTQLKDVNPSEIIKGSGSDYALERIRPKVSDYVGRFPESALNPTRDPNVARVLSGEK